MLTFKKTRDLDNEFDTTDIVFETNALTTTEILADFKCFLMACGYPVDFTDELVIVEEEDEA